MTMSAHTSRAMTEIWEEVNVPKEVASTEKAPGHQWQTENAMVHDEIDRMVRQMTVEGVERKKTAEDIEKITQHDLHRIWCWNAAVPETVEICVHDLIAERTRQQPDAPAICAWDGELSYSELDTLSTQLAHHLVGLGVGPQTIVPLCFEKSMWTSVAMLGVMKAGGASLGMDSTQPEERLRTIVLQIQPAILLASPQNQDLAYRLNISNVVLVDRAHLLGYSLSTMTTSLLPTVAPSSRLYVVFTSGSTGTPKGAVITHQNFSSGVKYQQNALGFNSAVRVFDFASYAFDWSWSNALHTLTAGGCLCVPHDSDRRGNIAKSMCELRVNYAGLTPTVSRLLNPLDVPTLQVIHLSGEEMTFTDVDMWKASTEILNTYGPAECTIHSTVQRIDPANREPPSIGRGFGCCTWVVDPTDSERLLPIGSTGELVIEGPIVGEGYIQDAEKTAAAFTEDPPWLLHGGPGIPRGRRGRLYRTGDLVRYNSDSTLVFMGRKDAQVKIRGQRVELGEVEHHVRQNLEVDMETSVVAEVITPKKSTNAILVVYLAIGKAAEESAQDIQAVLQQAIQGLEAQLAEQLPAYMVPSTYITMETIPMTATGKTDRRQLREMGAKLTLEELTALRPSHREQRVPATGMEQQLQSLWALILGVDASSIGADDSFLHIGGDSIQAMRLVRTARKQGLSLTVADVFSTPRLSALAQLVSDSIPPYLDPPPFSLIDAQTAAGLRSVLGPSGNVLDAYPVTGIQSHLVTAALSRPLGDCHHFFMDLPPGSNLGLLFNTCVKLWAYLDVLRTVFVDIGDQRLQAIMDNLDPMIDILEGQTSLSALSEEALRSDMLTTLHLGRPFTRFFITRTADGRSRLTIRLSHALYDGVSISIILSCFAAFYEGRAPPVVPRFSGYIGHLIEQQGVGHSHWRSLLKGSRITKMMPDLRLKQTDPSIFDPNQLTRFKRVIPSPHHHPKVTPATIFTTLCACAFANLTGSRDVVFGLVVSGRASLPSGLQGVVGPCSNTIPVRVQIPNTDPFGSALSAIHHQRVDGLAFETSQLSDIAQQCTDWPEDAQDFGFVVQFQNVDENPSTQLAGRSTTLTIYDKDTRIQYQANDTITVYAYPLGDSWELDVGASAGFYSPQATETVIEELVASYKKYCG